MRLRVFVAWFDMWVGAYWSREHRTLYVCLLPCVVMAFCFGTTHKRTIRRALGLESAE